MRDSSSEAVRRTRDSWRARLTLRAQDPGCSSAPVPDARGEFGTHLADAVAQRDHEVEAGDAYSSRCFVRFALMSIPRCFMTRTALDAAPSGCCRRSPLRWSRGVVLQERFCNLRTRTIAGAQERTGPCAAYDARTDARCRGARHES